MIYLKNQEIGLKITNRKVSNKSIILNNQEATQPLKIGLINLMPQKEITEDQFFRLLSNSQEMIEVKLIKMTTYKSTTTDPAHLEKNYHTFSEIEAEHFDGLIITGAPIETIPFEEVSYWEELKQVMLWSQSKGVSTLNICWGAQAALYVYYGIEKIQYKDKLFGLFLQQAQTSNPLMANFPKEFSYPQSRHTGLDLKKIKQGSFEIIAKSQDLGPTILTSDKNRNIYILGHLEYDTDTLKKEYDRDLARNLSPELPKNYFAKDDINQPIINNWEKYAHLFYKNWIKSLSK